MSTETLAIWRQHGKGPCFIQVGRLIRYPVTEVESFERNLKFGPSRGKSISATAFMQTTEKKIGRLRRSEFSERKSQAIIQAYLSHLFDRRQTGCKIAASLEQIQAACLGGKESRAKIQAYLQRLTRSSPPKVKAQMALLDSASPVMTVVYSPFAEDTQWISSHPDCAD